MPISARSAGVARSTRGPVLGHCRILRLLTVCLGFWLACAAPSLAGAQTTEFTSPLPDAGDLGADVNFAWNAVPGAEAYYLYVGTASGDKDIVNTGEIQETSWFVRDLPRGKTLYARIWVKVDGTWRYTEMVLRTLASAVLVNPTPGSIEVPLDVEFRWQRITGAEKYYLYVGSAPGLKDIVNSGETLATSFRPKAPLPEGELLYARLLTRRDNAWHYTDSTFTSRALTARLLAPADGAADVHASPLLKWTTVPEAVAYYVYIGSAPGLKDVVNSGETKATSLQLRGLQGNREYHLRLLTRKDSRWRYRDYTFRTRDVAALVSPAPGSVGHDPDLPLRWSEVLGAEKYMATVGTAPGKSDLYHSSETTATSTLARGLPGGEKVYIRIWTRSGGAWKFEDSTVETRAVPRFVAPRAGTIGFDGSRPFRWNRVAGATTYKLTVGTQLGAADLYESGPLTGTSVLVPGLPTSESLYARLSALVGGRWLVTDTVFASRSSVRSSWILEPVPKGRIEGGSVFRWAPVAVATGYRLSIGTGPGLADVYDTGQVRVTRHRIEGLPTDVVLHGRLTTYYPFSAAVSRDFTFTAGPLLMSDEQKLDFAMSFVAEARADALGNAPRPLGLVAELIGSRNLDFANCTYFTLAMLAMVDEANGGLTARKAGTCLVPNRYDCHTLVEILDPRDGRWILADPTFGFAPLDAPSGGYATLESLGAAARARDWGRIGYQYLTPEGDAYARGYYLDYPLLFMQPMDSVQSTPLWELAPVEDLYQQHGLEYQGNSWDFYAVRCTPGSASVSIVVDGSAKIQPCHADLGLTWVFGARSVQITEPQPEGATIMQPVRVQFER